MTYNDITHLKGSKITKDFVLRERNKTPVSKLVYALATDSTTGSVVIAFRGSACTENWVLNAESELVDTVFSKVKSPNNKIGGKVHKGFLAAIDVLYPLIKADYNQLISRALFTRYAQKEIIFVGHSLGGALATLTAASFLEDADFQFEKNQIKILGLAEPCVGNWNFVMSLENALEQNDPDTINHVHAYVNGDLVPGVSKLISNQYKAHGLGVRLNYRAFIKREGWKALSPFAVHYFAHDSSHLMKYSPTSIKIILRNNIKDASITLANTQTVLMDQKEGDEIVNQEVIEKIDVTTDDSSLIPTEAIEERDENPAKSAHNLTETLDNTTLALQEIEHALQIISFHMGNNISTMSEMPIMQDLNQLIIKYKGQGLVLESLK